ncbi:predicted protein [Postia placenta Mad-698-R]|nr:predicted protein [Postia placenta Mad-698-R]
MAGHARDIKCCATSQQASLGLPTAATAMSSGLLGQRSTVASVCAQANTAATNALYLSHQYLPSSDIEPSVSWSDEWFTENFPEAMEGAPSANVAGPIFGGSWTQEMRIEPRITAVPSMHSRMERYITEEDTEDALLSRSAEFSTADIPLIIIIPVLEHRLGVSVAQR